MMAPIDRVLLLHQPAVIPWDWAECRECGHSFPCPTYLALMSEEVAS